MAKGGRRRREYRGPRADDRGRGGDGERGRTPRPLDRKDGRKEGGKPGREGVAAAEWNKEETAMNSTPIRPERRGRVDGKPAGVERGRG
jgi:hypothetical protein